MIEAVAAFAATLTNPLALAAVLAAAFALARAARTRAAGAAVGCALALPDALAAAGGPLPLAAVPPLLASAAAGLLQAEICLHFVLPGWRLARAVAARLRLLGRSALGRSAPARVRQPPAPGAGPRADAPSGSRRHPG